MRRLVALGVVVVAALFVSVRPVSAAEILINGGFEGGFAGWTTVSQVGGNPNGAWYVQSGAGSPFNGFPVASPPEGLFAAMTDQSGAGSHVLYQDFIVPVGVSSASLDFMHFVANRAQAFVTPDTLAFNTGPNQQARVDIITTTANVFSVAAGDVLLNLFRTQVGDPLIMQAYALVSTDLTAFLQAHEGQTLRLRFAEVDNQLFFNYGVDDVSLDVEVVPEPMSLLLVGSGALALVRRRRSA
jgi:hypothetical protein